MKSVLPASRVSSSSRRQHRVAGVLVEVARRLVGQDQQRVVRQRAGNGDALLLAAAQLVGKVASRLPSPTRSSSIWARAAGLAPLARSVPAAGSHFPAR
jgi:hypothetical protein